MNWQTMALAIALGGMVFTGVAVRHLMRLTRALQASEERWKFALEGAGDGVWDWNVQEDSVVFSQRYKEMVGYTDEDIAANEDAWRQRIHPEDRTQVDEDIHAYLEGRTPNYSNEHRVEFAATAASSTGAGTRHGHQPYPRRQAPAHDRYPRRHYRTQGARKIACAIWRILIHSPTCPTAHSSPTAYNRL